MSSAIERRVIEVVVTLLILYGTEVACGQRQGCVANVQGHILWTAQVRIVSKVFDVLQVEVARLTQVGALCGNK
jgi:hypothetical protein